MSVLVHQEGEVLGVVVMIACNDVEHHTAIQLLEVLVVQSQPTQHAKQFLVGVAHVSVKMGDAGCRLHVNLLARRCAVETARHEVIAIAFGQQATFRHCDTASGRHLVVSILNITDALRVVGYLVMLAVGAAIELQEPIGETFGCRNLS